MSICSAVMPSVGAGHLEVHVAEVILVAEDVGQHREAVAFLDQAHRDAGHRRLDRHAGVHQREAGAAHLAIDELEPLDSVISETTRIDVREGPCRQHGALTPRLARLPWPISRRFGVPSCRSRRPRTAGCCSAA
jgi:hypothetical protein